MVDLSFGEQYPKEAVEPLMESMCCVDFENLGNAKQRHHHNDHYIIDIALFEKCLISQSLKKKHVGR